MSGRVSRALTAAGAAVALTLGLPAVASADSTVVVRGTQFPDARAQLAYVGCSDLFSRGDQALAPYIGFGPGQAPSGARSLGYDLAGGTAIGSQHVVGSVLGTTVATIGVHAAQGTTGLAVVGYQAPRDRGTQVMWLGVADVSVPAGGWTTVSATPRDYAWTRYDMATRTPLGAATPPVGVADFVASQGGDGPGLYALTFGCDGAPFSMDAMRVGSPGAVTTYDLEGLATSLTISASSALVRPGDTVTVRGHLVSAGPIAHATVILERRDPDSGRWENVRVVPAGPDGAVARLIPARSALSRWRFVDRPLAEGSTSGPLHIAVLADLPTDGPAGEQPAPGPGEEPGEDPQSPPAPDEPAPTPTLPGPPAPPTPGDPETPGEPSDPVGTDPGDPPTDPAGPGSPAGPPAADPGPDPEPPAEQPPAEQPPAGQQEDSARAEPSQADATP